jgi:hypothetical protein
LPSTTLSTTRSFGSTSFEDRRLREFKVDGGIWKRSIHNRSGSLHPPLCLAVG